MLGLEKIKARAKSGLHYSKWLFVWELINEVERLQKELDNVKGICTGSSNNDGSSLHSNVSNKLHYGKPQC